MTEISSTPKPAHIDRVVITGSNTGIDVTAAAFIFNDDGTVDRPRLLRTAGIAGVFGEFKLGSLGQPVHVITRLGDGWHMDNKVIRAPSTSKKALKPGQTVADMDPRFDFYEAVKAALKVLYPSEFVRESKVDTSSETPEARKTRITAEVEVLKTRIASEQDAMIKKILAKNLAVKEKSLLTPVVKIGVKDVLPADDNPGKNQADLNREHAKSVSKSVREGAGA